MYQTITITPQWQVYLPIKVREALSLTRPGRATLVVKDQSVVLIPQKSPLLKLAGKYKQLSQKKKIDLNKVRDRIDYSQL